MADDQANQLIDLIYDSALNPTKWTALLNALAEFVDYIEKQPDAMSSEERILSVLPQLSDNEDKASISSTLKSITSLNQESFFPSLKDANDVLIGHFIRALQIAKKLVDADEQHNVVLSLLDNMPLALILVDAQAHIIETNALANEMLMSNNDLHVNKKVLSVSKEHNALLLKTIAKMSKHDADLTNGQPISINDNELDNKFMLFVTPLKRLDTEQKASVAIFISQHKNHPFTIPEIFVTKYELTKQELKITELLVKGSSIKDISNKIVLSEHTVRSHVKSVLRKTNTSRQAELVSLVYNSMGDFSSAFPNQTSGKRTTLLNKKEFIKKDYLILTLKDGRHLAYAEYGNTSGEPIFYFHSVLGSRLEVAINAKEILEQHSARLIIIDRPGYGASDPNSKNNFLNWIDDLEELADHLKIDKFSTLGYAMGGVYTLAAAYKIPHRLKSNAMVSRGLPPSSSEDFNKMVPLYRMNNRIAKYAPKILPFLTSISMKGILSDPDGFYRQLDNHVCRTDLDIMQQENYKKTFSSSIKEAFRQGGKANAAEVIQLMHDWQFDIRDITLPIDIWHGSEDRQVPCVLGERAAELMTNTRLFIKPDQGHYMIFSNFSEILSKLLSVQTNKS